MNIKQFNPGEILTRIEPAYPVSNHTGDRSYMGEPLVLCGIKNGSIYLKRIDELEVKIFGDDPVRLSMDLWSNGWEKWEDPTKMCDNITIKSANRNRTEFMVSKINIKQIENSDIIGFTYRVLDDHKFGMMVFMGFFAAIGLKQGIGVPNTVLGNIVEHNFRTQKSVAKFINDYWPDVEFYKFKSHLDLVRFADTVRNSNK